MDQHPPDSIVVYSTVCCPDCKRAKQFFGEQRVPYRNIDIEHDAAAMAFVEQVNHGKRIIPTIVFPDGAILVEPSNAELAAKWSNLVRHRSSAGLEGASALRQAS